MNQAVESRTVLDAVVDSYLATWPGEAAEIMEKAAIAEVAEFMETVPPERSADVLRRLTPGAAAAVLAELTGESAGRFVAAMEPNRAAHLLARLDETRREALLEPLGEGAEELRELMRYPVDSAGHLMDARVTSFRLGTRVREVIRRLRNLRHERIQDLFLVDEHNRLVGAVPIQDVVLASPEERLNDLAKAPPLHVSVFSPREEVLEILGGNASRSLAVVDFEGKLLGVLRQEELISTAEQATATDLVTMVGAGKEERALSSPFFAVKKRLPWLEINLLTAFLAASVVGLFESTIARNTALAILLPVVAGQSGNTGAQALAVTMRGLALREVRLRHWLRVMLKEVAVGAMNGVAVAVSTAAAVFIWSRSFGLALVIGVSMIISMTAAGLAGAVIPMFLTRIGQDPAQSSSIILTTVTDVVGFFSFLGIATILSAML